MTTNPPPAKPAWYTPGSVWFWFILTGIVAGILSIWTVGIPLGIWALLWLLGSAAHAQQKAQAKEEASRPLQMRRQYSNANRAQNGIAHMNAIGYAPISTVTNFRSGRVSMVFARAAPLEVNQNITVRQEAPAPTPTAKCAYCSHVVPEAPSCAHCGAPLAVLPTPQHVIRPPQD